MRTFLMARFFCAATSLLFALPVASCWAADTAAASAEPRIDTFTRTLKLDEDPPKSSYWDVFLSGYAYHDRDTYTKAQLRKMNETTWGGGIGRSMRNERGNEEGVYLMGIRDSNFRPQWMAGYQYKWMFPLKSRNHMELGAGLTALLIHRHDWYNGRPFPAVLPVASIGNRAAQLVATYVPRLSDRKKKGNILSLMLKIPM
jgi:palmitoyl transferase